MAYSEEIKQTTKKAPKTLGNQLGRYAIHLDFPVIEVAKFTGATRQTVYNWFIGTYDPKASLTGEATKLLISFRKKLK